MTSQDGCCPSLIFSPLEQQQRHHLHLPFSCSKMEQSHMPAVSVVASEHCPWWRANLHQQARSKSLQSLLEPLRAVHLPDLCTCPHQLPRRGPRLSPAYGTLERGFQQRGPHFDANMLAMRSKASTSVPRSASRPFRLLCCSLDL